MLEIDCLCLLNTVRVVLHYVRFRIYWWVNGESFQAAQEQRERERDWCGSCLPYSMCTAPIHMFSYNDCIGIQLQVVNRDCRQWTHQRHFNKTQLKTYPSLAWIIFETCRITANRLNLMNSDTIKTLTDFPWIFTLNWYVHKLVDDFVCCSK